MSKRILVTGAAGFIGFHTIQALAARGDTVVGFDNFNDVYDPALKRARAAHLAEQKIEVVEGDIRNEVDLAALVRSFRPTHLLHLAARAGVRDCLHDPHCYTNNNLTGFLNILETCRHHQLPLVYASSSSVYGANSKLPFSESDRADAPSNLYGATKKANELMAHSYHYCYGTPITGLRFFTVYGPWGRPDMAYFKFSQMIERGETIPLYNRGAMSRDFTYIDDIVSGIVAAIDLEAPCEVFNLGNSTPEPLMDMVRHLENFLGKKAQLELLPMQPGEMEATCADLSHSQRCLGFTPQVSLEDGLHRFASWFASPTNPAFSPQNG